MNKFLTDYSRLTYLIGAIETIIDTTNSLNATEEEKNIARLLKDVVEKVMKE